MIFRQNLKQIPQHQQKVQDAQDQKLGLARNRTGVARTVQTRSMKNEGSEPEVITATLRNRSKNGEFRWDQSEPDRTSTYSCIGQYARACRRPTTPRIQSSQSFVAASERRQCKVMQKRSNTCRMTTSIRAEPLEQTTSIWNPTTRKTEDLVESAAWRCCKPSFDTKVWPRTRPARGNAATLLALTAGR
jgi:hypothetical protein